MRYFIHALIDDFWTALKNDRIIESDLKPHPYKEYRELTMEERIIYRGMDHLIIFFHHDRFGTFEERKALQWKSMENDVAETFPDLAKTHGLKIDRSHEYWKSSLMERAAPKEKVTPHPNDLPTCSTEAAREYHRRALAFIEMVGMYHDAKQVASMAIAEYLAYQDGFSIRSKS